MGNDRVKLPNVDRRRVGGTVYKYHRVTRTKLPCDVPEDHPRFIAAWTAEQAKTDAPARIDGPAGTIAAAIRGYLGSKGHADLSPDYRRPIRSHLEAIAEAYGLAQLRDLRPRHISADLAQLDTNPARARRKAWRKLCTWAKDHQHIIEDPSAAVSAPRARKTSGHLPWTADDIAAFRSHWPIETAQRLAFELTFWTAARRGDAARLSTRMIGRDGVLVFDQGKTGNPSHVPWTCALPAYADRDSHRHLMACLAHHRPELMMVVTQTGKARSPKAFGGWLAEAARAAGVDKTAHGLRKSRLTQIAESGGSVHAIMSWGGHVTLSEAQDYIDSANRKKAVMGSDPAPDFAQSPNPPAQKPSNSL